jgi:signal transduction histidine kinase
VAQSGESLNVPDLQIEERHYKGVDRKTGLALRAIISAPLRIKRRTIGVLQVVDANVGRFSADDLALLESVAVSASVAIENARLFEQTRHEIAQREAAEAAQRQQAHRLKVLSRQLVAAQEAERRHIARELHDEIGQILTMIKVNLQALQAAGDPPARSPLLDESIELTTRTLDQVRDLSLDLRPSVLDDLGLVPALQWYVNRQTQQSGLVVQITTDLEGERLDPMLEITCFRIVQEAVTNVTRHSQARHLGVGLQQETTELHMHIRDDGVGFNAEQALEHASRGKSLGLLSMQERAALAGGQLEIESAPGLGTEIRARFPLTPYQSNDDQNAKKASQ